ncbi:MAG: DNA primase [Desulforhabdus sp.]|nr:DNA primase [Desulforhabdus sp.]
MSNSDLAALVKQAVDITDVIGQVVALRRVGNRYVGLCPFHHEKTPSFHVDSENQFYHCFGCGTGGDVLSFVMKQQNLSFMEAINHLADRYHLVLPQTGDTQFQSAAAADASRKEREQLYRVLEIAEEFFYRQLHHSRQGKIARDYIEQRGLPTAVVETERLGYAPDEWSGLLQHFNASGISAELGIKAGLLVRSPKDRIYDRFRHRLIFPIRDERKKVVAFGGRSLSGKTEGANGRPTATSPNEPKYLNGPETPVYHKGRMLYQYARAREECRQIRQVILVEGYMDLLAFHARGFYRVAATLGTALTVQQVRLLRRMCDEVVLAYDADEAGEKAMLRGLPLFLQEQLAVSCVRFPDGMDPDDFLRSNGIGGLEALLSRREDLGIYAINKNLAGWDGSISGKPKVLSELKPILEDVRQPVMKSEYVRLISERLSLSESAVIKQFQIGGAKAGKNFTPRSKLHSHQPQAQSLEESVVRALIRYPALIEEVRSSGALDHFNSPQLKAITEILLQVVLPPYDDFKAAAVYDSLQDDESRDLFTHFLLETRELTCAQIHMDDWLKALCERAPKRMRTDLREALRQAERGGDTNQVRELLTQIQSLCSKKRVMDSPDNVEGERNR